MNRKPIEVACYKGRKKFFKVKTWAELRVGDIVKMYANQEVPADILILDIQGCKLEKQTCKMRGGLWDD